MLGTVRWGTEGRPPLAAHEVLDALSGDVTAAVRHLAAPVGRDGVASAAASTRAVIVWGQLHHALAHPDPRVMIDHESDVVGVEGPRTINFGDG
jgi:hypothetical protein